MRFTFTCRRHFGTVLADVSYGGQVPRQRQARGGGSHFDKGKLEGLLQISRHYTMEISETEVLKRFS